ncbi:aminoglycoside phosphotransferase family protein [Agarivorans sp. Alg241-V36]|uniref:aminoglycoside phosphotransferase family protein n=1 Tax=Agarivorans sp. Alg241-V36 TaxID=2305992 RepID=UPI001F086AAE|nr:aminoglycoside phosphotransferase family protein [Agarivorans sp. Alg241-V36]
MPDTDNKWLLENQVKIIRTPEGISLGASLVAALNLSEHNLDSPLHILFGDTLFTELPIGEDLVCVSDVQENYNWAVVTDDELHRLKDSDHKIENNAHNVVNGYFKFNKPRQLIRSITQSNWKFLEGLNKYHCQIGLTTIYSNKWLDFGHVNSYYRSKANFTTQRAFNQLTITSNWVEKSSSNTKKISAEANWFEKLPLTLRSFIPQYLGTHKTNQNASYRLEYLHLTALNELYVFSELSLNTWEQILDGCMQFLKACQSEEAPNTSPANPLSELLENKTRDRLNEYCHDQKILLSDEWVYNKEKPIALADILHESSKHLPKSLPNSQQTVLHGDFCFSNILYDFRAGKIKTIDPRGVTPEGIPTIYGDIRYDIAKLSHSILGMYDWVMAGYYELTQSQLSIDFHIEESQQHKAIQQRFIDLIKQEFSLPAVTLLAMQVQLFLSMLPLHSDDKKRQRALFANAIRLYFKMKRLEKWSLFLWRV